MPGYLGNEAGAVLFLKKLNRKKKIWGGLEVV